MMPAPARFSAAPRFAVVADQAHAPLPDRHAPAATAHGDVRAARFADAVAEHRPHVLGMQDVIEELRRRGLREQVKLLIGGSPVSKRLAEQIGTDAWQAVGLVRSLM